MPGSLCTTNCLQEYAIVCARISLHHRLLICHCVLACMCICSQRQRDKLRIGSNTEAVNEQQVLMFHHLSQYPTSIFFNMHVNPAGCGGVLTAHLARHGRPDWRSKRLAARLHAALESLRRHCSTCLCCSEVCMPQQYFTSGGSRDFCITAKCCAAQQCRVLVCGHCVQLPVVRLLHRRLPAVQAAAQVCFSVNSAMSMHCTNLLTA